MPAPNRFWEHWKEFLFILKTMIRILRTFCIWIQKRIYKAIFWPKQEKPKECQKVIPWNFSLNSQKLKVMNRNSMLFVVFFSSSPFPRWKSCFCNCFQFTCIFSENSELTSKNRLKILALFFRAFYIFVDVSNWRVQYLKPPNEKYISKTVCNHFLS